MAPGQVVPGHSVIAVTALEDPAIAPSTIDVETIVMTPEHPFYTAAGDWVPACRLHAADNVRKADGLHGVVRSVVLVPRLQVMYNLTVAGAHTYFVGDGQWLVHNCPVRNPKLLLDDKQFGKKAGEHMKDFGLDPGDLSHRTQFRGLIEDIYSNAQEVRQGVWRGGNTDYLFYRKGDVVVVTKPNGEFVTILNQGPTNGWFLMRRPQAHRAWLYASLKVSVLRGI